MRVLLVAVFAVAILSPLVLGDRIPAARGDIQITPIGHAAVQVEYGGQVIRVDPWSESVSLGKAKPADLVLATHVQGDHGDPAGIAKVRKPGGMVIVPAALRDL